MCFIVLILNVFYYLNSNKRILFKIFSTSEYKKSLFMPQKNNNRTHRVGSIENSEE